MSSGLCDGAWKHHISRELVVLTRDPPPRAPTKAPASAGAMADRGRRLLPPLPIGRPIDVLSTYGAAYQRPPRAAARVNKRFHRRAGVFTRPPLGLSS
jgi:hypothetical protein